MLFRTKRSLVASLVATVCLAAILPATGHTVQEDAASAVDTSNRPVLLTTEFELQRAQARSADPSSPFHDAWLSVKADADQALNRDFIPREPNDIRAPSYYDLVNPESQAIHALAVAYRVTGNTAYLTKARDALMEWAVYSNADLPPNDPSPSWRDFHYPGKAMPHAAGLHISRILLKFADAYAIIEPYLTAGEQAEIKRWFSSMRSPIQYSTLLWETADWFMSSPTITESADPPWLDGQYYNNHLSAHTLGQLAIGYVTGNDTLVSYALNDNRNPRDLWELFLGVLVMPGDALRTIKSPDPSLGGDDERWPDPLPNEIYDRYRVNSKTAAGDRGLIYSALNQRFLSLSAELVNNNSGPSNYWRRVADSGESLRGSYAVYAPFLSETRANAVSCRDRYYEESANTSNQQNNWRSMMELAFREHPYDPAIRAVINTADRHYRDSETFGHLAPLLDGELLDPPGGPALTYRSSGGSTPTTPLQIPASAGANAHFLGDWDGDGDDTPGWRIGRTFYLSNSPSGANPSTHTYGRACEDPLVGDWDGDGDDTIGVRNKKRFLLSNDNTAPADVDYSAGRPSDRVIIGDWNGNGIDAPGLIRGKQMILRTNNNTTPTYLPDFTFARVGDRFVAGDWNGDGTDTLGAVREVNGNLTWFLKSGNSEAAPVTSTITHGDILDAALTGDVNGGNADELATVRYR